VRKKPVTVSGIRGLDVLYEDGTRPRNTPESTADESGGWTAIEKAKAIIEVRTRKSRFCREAARVRFRRSRALRAAERG